MLRSIFAIADFASILEIRKYFSVFDIDISKTFLMSITSCRSCVCPSFVNNIEDISCCILFFFIYMKNYMFFFIHLLLNQKMNKIMFILIHHDVRIGK